MACGGSDDLRSSNLVPSRFSWLRGCSPAVYNQQGCLKQISLPAEGKVWLQFAHWEHKLPQPQPQLPAEHILHWISLLSWALTHLHPFTYLLEKKIFLISVAEGVNLRYFASTAGGFIILPQRVQAICASPKEKNNKQLKTCQRVSKLLNEQLFKPTWVTHEIKLSPYCATQAAEKQFKLSSRNKGLIKKSRVEKAVSTHLPCLPWVNDA